MEDEDLNVESDEPIINDEGVGEEVELSKASPFADVACHITQYEDGGLPADEFITVLVGMANSGENDLFVDGIEASFRYPQDFNYYIQNVRNYYIIRVLLGFLKSSRCSIYR